MKCRICKTTNLVQLPNIGINTFSLSSDNKSLFTNIKLFKCTDCELIQKFYDTPKLKECLNAIYNNYSAHYLSFGKEQVIFKDNMQIPRSEYILKECKNFLPEKGILLDYGCGNGAVLKSTSKILPLWELEAYDIIDHYKDEIINIPKVIEFYINIEPKKKYDLIIFWHSLEHVDNINHIFIFFKTHLKENGMILIQVPDYTRNLYDLAVFDHCNHFSNKTLINLFEKNNFEVIVNGHFWLHNVLTVLFKIRFEEENIIEEISNFNKKIHYIDKKVQDKDFVIFGTGMASIYLYTQLSTKPKFFIDEDENKRNTLFESIAIKHPKDISNKSIVILLPFESSMVEIIKNKLMHTYNFQNIISLERNQK